MSAESIASRARDLGVEFEERPSDRIVVTGYAAETGFGSTKATWEGLSQKSRVEFGHYYPQNVLTNEEIESWEVATPSGSLLTAESIAGRVGVLSRFVARDTETPISMGVAAAHEALKDKKPDVILASTSFPVGVNVANAIGDELGLPPTLHGDIHAACSGFVMGLNFLKEHEERFTGARVLFVATEKYHPYMQDLREGIGDDPALSQTIFSDGAVAASFIFGKDLKVVSGSNTPMYEHSELIGMPIDGEKIVGNALTVPIRYTPKIYQNGHKIFELMIKEVPKNIEKEIEASGIEKSQIKAVLSHQGSKHMIESASKRMKELDVIKNYKEGNFSSATVPKIMMDLKESGSLKAGNYVVAGFGAGLFLSKAIIEIN